MPSDEQVRAAAEAWCKSVKQQMAADADPFDLTLHMRAALEAAEGVGGPGVTFLTREELDVLDDALDSLLMGLEHDGGPMQLGKTARTMRHRVLAAKCPSAPASKDEGDG